MARKHIIAGLFMLLTVIGIAGGRQVSAASALRTWVIYLGIN